MGNCIKPVLPRVPPSPVPPPPIPPPRVASPVPPSPVPHHLTHNLARHLYIPPSTVAPSASFANLAHLKESCDPFSLMGETHLGYCVKAYDGDTCTINIHSNVGNHQWKVRLVGFDAPELRTSNPLEKKHGLACRDMLLELIHTKYVVVQCDKFEKYGRLLGTVWVRSVDVMGLRPVVGSDDGTESHNILRSSRNTNIFKTESCELADVKRIVEGNLSGLVNVNEWMLKHTPCVPYDGGTKAKVTYAGSYHPRYLHHLNTER